MSDYADAVQRHYERIFQTVPEVVRFDKGPVHELPEEFAILVFPPRPIHDMWIYATRAMSQLADPHPLELHLFAPGRHDGIIELLTAVAHYHRTGASLGLGDTVNFGRPWWPGSQCDHGLLSRPYLDGPELEWLTIGDRSVQFLWLIPITESELRYKKRHGLEALEDRFEQSGFNYADPLRQSVVDGENVTSIHPG